MQPPHLSPCDLRDKTIDVHAHVGVTIRGYARQEYPYAQTIEDLLYRHRAAGVDAGVVFPLAPDLYFDPRALIEGIMTPSTQPVSPAPYAIENEMVMTETFRCFPELARRFIPFVSADPARAVDAQVRALQRLRDEYPFYGFKISPIVCQSKALTLLDAGRPLMELARALCPAVLFHTTVDTREEYSQPGDIFRIIERYPDLRFCLAHAIGFDAGFLKLADQAPNVWVDTAALTIQVQLAREGNPIMAPPARRIDADFSDHRKVMLALMEQFPDTIVWGSDSPAYTYIARRRQAEGVWVDFRLRATYGDEKAALDALPSHLRRKACNANTLQFLFGAA
jgi:predicted TIM-barrel fold metal-dependent hydrolase